MHGNALTHFLPDPVDCAVYLSFYIFVCLLVYYVSFVLILNVLNMCGQRTLLLPKTNAPQWRQHALIMVPCGSWHCCYKKLRTTQFPPPTTPWKREMATRGKKSEQDLKHLSAQPGQFAETA